MIEAIVFTSETGHTRAYAALLGEALSLPAHEGKEAAEKLPAGTEIIYLGWLMAGKIKGYRKAARRYRIAAVCAVGMADGVSQTDDIREQNALPASVPLFQLQGGFDIEKLHGIYRFMMNCMKNTVGRAIENKNDRTAEEEEMHDLLINGGNRVSAEKLAPVIGWAKEQIR